MRFAKLNWRTTTGRQAKILPLVLALSIGACKAGPQMEQSMDREPVAQEQASSRLKVGAELTDRWLPMLQGKAVAVVTNQTGMIGTTHLVDSLLALKVRVVKVFAPEHGFRGEADAGAHVKDERDTRTGLPLVSLYGANKKPTDAQLVDVDVILFDIQDAGVRFYTYIGTLHYVMEAAARNGKRVMVLDRPNPNGAHVDGPVLDMAHSSFVGMHPVPLVHGMTVGEFANMINGEGWLKDGSECDLVVIPCEGYDHQTKYELPVRPSPNLPNMQAILLYPSLGLFEGTIVSVGRGTTHPFQWIGYPGNPVGDHTFTPRPMPGAKDPPHKGVECTGLDLRNTPVDSLDPPSLQWLIEFYQEAPDKKAFFNNFFDKLSGGPALRQSIMAGEDEETIRAGWETPLVEFKKLRRKYLLYDDRVN